MTERFIGIGAQKCASSWMHDILADHPQVGVPATKELDFFSHRHEFGYRWYEGQFPHSAALRMRGEISPSYFHEPAATARAQDYDRSMRILVSLRDPVERALSQHRHLARLGLLPPDDLTFETALANNPTYVDQGRYFAHLSRWIDTFGPERVHVVLMEDIRQDPAAVARHLYQFLGVDDTHQPAALRETSNPSYVPRSRALELSVRLVRGGIQRLGLGGAWKRVGDSGLRGAYRSLNRRRSEDVLPPPAPTTLDELRERMAPDLEKLSRLIRRDLSTWMPQAHRT